MYSIHKMVDEWWEINFPNNHQAKESLCKYIAAAMVEQAEVDRNKRQTLNTNWLTYDQVLDALTASVKSGGSLSGADFDFKHLTHELNNLLYSYENEAYTQLCNRVCELEDILGNVAVLVKEYY